MKATLFKYLPEYFRNGPDALNTNGVLAGTILWSVVFLILGLILGGVFFRKGRWSIVNLEKENSKGLSRLEIYRATVEKQMSSDWFK